MQNPRPRAAATALAVAALLLVAAAAPAPAAPARQLPAKLTLVKQIVKLDGQYQSLQRRVQACASATRERRVAARQRANARPGATVRRSLANLQVRRARMAAAVVRLARAAKVCATAPTATATATSNAVPGPTAGTAAVLLPDLLGGVSLSVGNLTGGLPLGELVTLVDVDQLAGPICTSPGVSCVGIDTAALDAALARVTNAALLSDLLDLDLGGTLGSVTALLDAGRLSGLIGVERVSDTVIRLVPLGPLAELTMLPAIPAVPVGAIDLTG